VSQRSAGTTNAITRNGTGANTSQPSSQAESSLPRDRCASNTITQAQTNVALMSAAETVGARMSPTVRDTSLKATAIAAAGKPSTRQAQKCAP
jgi:hypothetical protein